MCRVCNSEGNYQSGGAKGLISSQVTPLWFGSRPSVPRKLPSQLCFFFIYFQPLFGW